ncbi:peptidoglycan-binding domain-containing protein [Nocardioides sp. NPDC126508]
MPLRVGGKVTAGDLIAEVSGRPVLVLEGLLPAYRTLKPGLEGPDVRQLQRALSRAGLFSGAVDGVYGPATAGAVSDLYRLHGLEPVMAGLDEVKAAKEAVAAAEGARDVAPGERGLDPVEGGASSELRKARADLAAARSVAGASVPVGEVVFVSDLPAFVSAVDAGVGTPPGESLLTLSAGPLVLRGTPNSVDAIEIKRGAQAKILLSPQGDVKGKVSTSERKPTGASEQPGGGNTIFTVVPNTRLSDSSKGRAARVIVTVDTSAEAGLVVPDSALSVDAKGRSSVTVMRSGGTISTVAVIPGFTGDGLSRVDPVEAGALVEGDRIVVGVDR